MSSCCCCWSSLLSFWSHHKSLRDATLCCSVKRHDSWGAHQTRKEEEGAFHYQLYNSTFMDVIIPTLFHGCTVSSRRPQRIFLFYFIFCFWGLFNLWSFFLFFVHFLCVCVCFFFPHSFSWNFFLLEIVFLLLLGLIIKEILIYHITQFKKINCPKP
jgi:hypothetical protein